MNRKQQAASDFAQRMIALGFVAYIAENGDYGFITDDAGSRVLSFSMSGLVGHLSGNYGPPSHESGTGWKLDRSPDELKTADDVRAMLYATPPPFAGRGWNYVSTVTQYLAMYGGSSRFTKIEGRTA